eukprot:604407-Amphidinium_carterae.1
MGPRSQALKPKVSELRDCVPEELNHQGFKGRSVGSRELRFRVDPSATCSASLAQTQIPVPTH